MNFNGTGTVAIRASGNVSSITDNGTGKYTVNFTTAMPDTSYCVNATAITQSDAGSAGIGGSNVVTTSNVQVRTATSATSYLDYDFVCVAIHR